MTQVLIASNNQGKIREIKTLLADFDVRIRTLKDLGITVDVPETGTTFKENASLKAEALSKKTHLITIADDSGLSVDVLNGEPGIFSARYSGPEKDSERNIDKLLRKLEGVPMTQRAAHFSCTLALSIPGEATHFVVGRCDGVITMARHGTDGFGYDPVFLVSDEKETFAEMGDEKKNQISHRALALKQLREKWPEWVDKQK
jgi:non-canonical purine NTP pyrophosphatase, rdgB/HAM1 family